MSIVYTTLTAAYRLWNDWLASQRKATVSFVEFIDEQEFGYVDHGFQAGLVVAPMDAGVEVRIDPAIDAITWVWNEGRHFAQWQRYPIPEAVAGLTATQTIVDDPHRDDAFAGDDPFAAATRDIARGS